MVNCCLTWCSPRMTATTTCAVCTTWCWALRGNHIHLHPVPSTTGLRFARSHRPWGQLSAAAAVALQRQTCYATMAWPQNSSDQPTSTEWNAAADNVTAVRWFDKCDAFAMSTIHENDMISIQWCLLCVCVCIYYGTCAICQAGIQLNHCRYLCCVHSFHTECMGTCLEIRSIRPLMSISLSVHLTTLFQQEAQLSSDRAMRLVSSNLANCHATVQKLLIQQVLTKLMVWSWKFSRRQCVMNNVHSTMTRPLRLPLTQVS